MLNQSFDAGGIAKEQQSQMAASAAIWVNALKPMIHLQVSLVRLWANNVEALAQNCEKGLDTFSSAVEQQTVHHRAA